MISVITGQRPGPSGPTAAPGYPRSCCRQQLWPTLYLPRPGRWICRFWCRCRRPGCTLPSNVSRLPAPVMEPVDLINTRCGWCCASNGRHRIDSDDDQPAKQFGDIKWQLTSRVRGTIVRSFGGGDALWAFRCNNKLEKGVINTQGVSRFRDLADGVTLLRSTYAGAVVLPESRLPTHRDCSCRRAGVWRRGPG